ncbi:DUF2141 domain-containing protein [Spirosoma fluviale]|uniref:Uncharacterized conserved protein, DUF2141 family n=1 Tax=Spirosoma fluviale TaxID=1597977 RepID=A0A286GTW1_9BACT|nr:DUF2141 domain-containing protein [Spirosoma fluviale]SOD98626.1 Uncharacterized conserved protein, DUF2141 family [Spirosoma fluviale]
MFYLLSLFGFLLSSPATPDTPKKTNLTIEVHNVRALTGAVYVAVFKPGKDFPEGKPIVGKKVDVTHDRVLTTFSVEPGSYAIAVYHDENGNGKMDKRMFGIPKEPYGFSNDFRPKLSAPKFSDCEFSVGDSGRTVRIKLDGI